MFGSIVSHGKDQDRHGHCVRVDLGMRCELAANLSSPSQRARVLTEAWVEDNMYCPACESDSLDRLARGTRLLDFRCGDCEEGFQLKAQRHAFGKRVLDSAWSVMHEAVTSGSAPGFLFVRYDSTACRVSQMFVVPGHFVTPMVIEKRPPLREHAQRAHWIGCNILLENIPAAARIAVVEAPSIHPAREVREHWRRFAFVKKAQQRAPGWVGDVLACVQRLGKPSFTLHELYAFEDELKSLHPENQNIQAKIRQQLQVLRDRRIVRFLGRGTYSVTEG